MSRSSCSRADVPWNIGRRMPHQSPCGRGSLSRMRHLAFYAFISWTLATCVVVKVQLQSSSGCINIQVGSRVARGRDWRWSNQDGHPGNLGTVIGPSEENPYVPVLWGVIGTSKKNYFRNFAKFCNLRLSDIRLNTIKGSHLVCSSVTDVPIDGRSIYTHQYFQPIPAWWKVAPDADETRNVIMMQAWSTPIVFATSCQPASELLHIFSSELTRGTPILSPCSHVPHPSIGLSPFSIWGNCLQGNSAGLKTDNFVMRMMCFINMQLAGLWTFFTESDDGSRLWIGSTCVVENNYAQPMTERFGVFNFVQPGWQATTIEWSNGISGIGFNVRWQKVTAVLKVIIPASRFSATPTLTNPLVLVFFAVSANAENSGIIFTMTGARFSGVPVTSNVAFEKTFKKVSSPVRAFSPCCASNASDFGTLLQSIQVALDGRKGSFVTWLSGNAFKHSDEISTFSLKMMIVSLFATLLAMAVRSVWHVSWSSQLKYKKMRLKLWIKWTMVALFISTTPLCVRCLGVRNSKR
jgi:hypothetical protein